MPSFGKLCVYLISAPICFFNHGVHTREYFYNNKVLRDIQSMKANNDKIILKNISKNSISLGGTVSEFSLMQHIIFILIHLSDILL